MTVSCAPGSQRLVLALAAFLPRSGDRSTSVLTINAEVRRDERQGGHWFKRERRVGTHVRTLHLSGNVAPRTTRRIWPTASSA